MQLLSQRRKRTKEQARSYESFRKSPILQWILRITLHKTLMGQLAEKRPPDLAALYEQDLCAWAQANADLLRVGQLADIDAARIAEELEDMGKSERRSLRGHTRNLMVHLLKWQHQPERRCTSWELSILNARNEIKDILVESPSLVAEFPDCAESVYAAARKIAALETKLDISTFPKACSYSTEQLRDEGFQPGS